MSNSEDHATYIKRKEDKTIKLFEEQMIKGKIFENIDSLTGSISDFTDSKKPMTVKSNTNPGQQSKNTKDQSTKKDNIGTQNPVKNYDDEVWSD